MHELASARQPIETMIRSGDLEGLLRQAEAIHGHLCPFVSLGVKAGQYAMKHLDTGSTGMEEVVAIVECNNCFTDGIQVVTGCTFGNNALIFRDLGQDRGDRGPPGEWPGGAPGGAPRVPGRDVRPLSRRGAPLRKGGGPEKRHPRGRAPFAPHLAGHGLQRTGSGPWRKAWWSRR